LKNLKEVRGGKSAKILKQEKVNRGKLKKSDQNDFLFPVFGFVAGTIFLRSKNVEKEKGKEEKTE